MGEVIIVMRILPESPDTTKKVKAALEKMSPNRLEEEPIGFGLVAFKFTKIIPDASGTQEKLENDVAAIKGIGSWEVLMANRAM